MNMYHICSGCGNVFERDLAAEKLRYDYKRTFRCPIPISPRCQGTVRWLKEDDAKIIPRKIVPICSRCNNEYTDPWLAESMTEASCTHCYQRTQIKWVNKENIRHITIGLLWFVISILGLASFLCYKSGYIKLTIFLVILEVFSIVFLLGSNLYKKQPRSCL